MRGMKKCVTCKETKAFNVFAKNKHTKDGLQTQCKDCQKLYREMLKTKLKPKFEKLGCARCNITKPVEEFPIVGSSSTGFGSWCKECKSKYQQGYDYREGYRNRRRERVQWFRSIKAGQPCADCGQVLEPSCMDYDHVNGNKTDHVSRMVLDNTPKKKILEEIQKCELVCLICHNRRTQNRFVFCDNKYRPHVKRNIDIINELKNRPCEYCGQQYESFNMQFDHTDPFIKEMNISQLKSSKIDRLMNEVKKCRLLCAVCHRRKTLIEQKAGVYPKYRNKEKKLFIDIDNKQRECTRCHEILSFDKFRANKKVKCGIDSWCRDCANAAKRERRRKIA